MRCRVYDADCINDAYCRERDACCAGDMDCTPATATDLDEQLAAWKAFAARVTLSFPFRVDVLLEIDRPQSDCIQMGVELHVLERDTREPITVRSRQHCGSWTDEERALDLLFDLLKTALTHEMNESVRLDGKLVRDQHARINATPDAAGPA